MKFKFFITTSLFLIFLYSSLLSQSAPNYKFGGHIELKAYTDDYRSRTSRNDLVNYYPLRPIFGENGADLNKFSTLNASVFASRLNFSVTGMNYLNADVNAYIETDFNGSSDANIYMVNLRHAYINFAWKNRSTLLLGQTDHLSLVREVLSGTIAFGAGFPFNPLNRSIQVRYSKFIYDNIEFLAAAHMYSGHNSVGPAKAQSQSGIPDLQVQFKFGKPSSIFGGFTLGYRTLRPVIYDVNNIEVNNKASFYNVGAFFRAQITKDVLFRTWAIYGDNMTMLGQIGGYGFRAGRDNIYNNKIVGVETLSGWADLDFKLPNNYKAGIFFGYQQNMGTSKDLALNTNSSNSYIYSFLRDPNLMWFSRLSPRVEYIVSGKFTLAVEYSHITAKWAKEIDSKLKPLSVYKSNSNNRLELMAKLNF